MRFTLALAAGPVVLAAFAFGASAQTCTDDRYACEPKPIAKSVEQRPAPQAQAAAVKYVKPENKAATRPSLQQSSYAEKAPPDPPRPQIKPVRNMSWQPIDVPSAHVQPIDGKEAFAMGDVEVVSADELNEIDLAALPAPEPVKIVPIRVVWPAPPETQSPQQAAVAQPEPSSADISLLERVLIACGGAFGAASALRMFVG
jgi:hypothetical protein